MEKNRTLDTKKCIHCKVCTNHCSFLKKYGLDISDTERLRELAYHCFLCGECSEVCPQNIDGRGVILGLRQEQVRNAGGKVEEPGYGMLIKEKKNYIFRNYRHARTKSVLFPGCNFPSYYPATTRKLVELLEREAGIGVAYDCCGKPIAELGMENAEEEIIRELEKLLKENGIEELIMVCPNCYDFLKSRISVRVVSIYEKLTELGIGEEIKEEMQIFLPCPDRREQKWIEWMKPFLGGKAEVISDVQCCGLGGCARAKEPELAEGFAKTLGERGYQNIYTYCGSCAGNLSRNGCGNVKHMLTEILEARERPDTAKSMANRMKTKFI